MRQLDLYSLQAERLKDRFLKCSPNAPRAHLETGIIVTMLNRMAHMV